MNVRSRPLEYYTRHWSMCGILASHRVSLGRVRERIGRGRAAYFLVETATGVPWRLVGALHYREANCRFSRGLHSGERWDGVTRQAPRGRGPFSNWHDAAVDALVLAGAAGRRPDEWSVAEMLRAAERFNGWGYAFRNRPSPYVWNWTDQGIGAGYFTADGRYDPRALNRQAGVAAILKAFEEGEIG